MTSGENNHEERLKEKRPSLLVMISILAVNRLFTSSSVACKKGLDVR